MIVKIRHYIVLPISILHISALYERPFFHCLFSDNWPLTKCKVTFDTNFYTDFYALSHDSQHFFAIQLQYPPISKILIGWRKILPYQKMEWKIYHREQNQGYLKSIHRLMRNMNVTLHFAWGHLSRKQTVWTI